jgi:glycosyltransferase 2 family protein
MKTWRVVRIVLSALALAWLIRRYGPSIRPPYSAHLGWVIPPLAFSLLVIQPAAALRWRVFLRAAGLERSLRHILRINFVSIFWGLLLPSADGFALIRAALMESASDAGRASGSVIAEKALGMVTLGLFALGASFFTDIPPGLRAGILLYLFASLAAITLLLGWTPRQDRTGWRATVDRAAAALRSGFRPAVILRALPWVLVVQAASFLSVFFLFKAFAVNVPLADCFCGVPAIQAISLLPVTFNGFGLREGAFAWYFGRLCNGPGIPIALSLLNFAVLTLLPATVGAALTLFTRRIRPSDEATHA